MSLDRRYLSFSGRICMVGFGSIGQGVLPLLLRHIGMTSDQITIVTAEERGRAEAGEYGVTFLEHRLTRDNYRGILTPLLGNGDFLVNLSVDVSSKALVEFAQSVGAFYIDTCIEPWQGGYTDPALSPALRTNYALREDMLSLKGSSGARPGPTAVITHGANPGLVSHFVKAAMLNIAHDVGLEGARPQDRDQWAKLAQDLGIKVIHIAERDTQISSIPKRVGEFVNTWSIDGFTSEGCQPAELGWGTHEKSLPPDGRTHEFGGKAAIWLTRPGAGTRVRSWTPLEGPYHGFLITHNEAISISEYFSRTENGEIAYRPTCHYAYHPCDAAVSSLHELAGRNWHTQTDKRLMMEEIVSGRDELGVLLLGHPKGAYWYGSRLTIEETRALIPHNNATGLQVTAPVLAGIIWALENPDRGVIEPEDLDHERILEICRPYLGEIYGGYSDWTPLLNREELFAEDVDREDPWQFKNFRVA